MLASISDHLVAIPIGWASIVALFIPVLTAVVVKYRQSTRAPQAIVAFAAAGALAVLQMLLDDVPNDTVASIAAAFLGVFIPMVASYIGFWQPVVDVNKRIAPNTGA